ncbi:MAG: hypothetical protein K6C94_03955 [Candidatus Gastranaerophilales bacterium]|nr:hypothetical protein [Candidatus Gastranaerophilales bacterium]
MFFKDLSVKGMGKKEISLYIAITTIVSMFSVTSYFVIFSWILYQIIKGKSQLKKLFIIQIPMLIALYLYYTTTLAIQKSQILNTSTAWEAHFLSLNFLNNLYIIKDAIRYFFDTNSHSLLLLMLISVLIVFGMSLVIKNIKTNENAMAIIIVLAISAASFLKIYSLYQRAIFFILPLIIIFAVKILDLISVKRKLLSLIILIAALFAFHNYNLSYIKNSLDGNIWYCRFLDGKYPNPKGMMQTIIENYDKKDAIIINFSSVAAFLYYQKYYNFSPEKTMAFLPNHKIPEDLENLQGNQKYWFYWAEDWSPKMETTQNLKQWKNNYSVILEKIYPSSDSYLLYLQK